VSGHGPGSHAASVVTATVVAHLRLAFLNRRFALAIAPWPEINGGLIQRLITRSRRLSLQSAIYAVPRVEERVELTLWQLAYRFGRVPPAGVVLDLRLTHSQLADMVAAQRPSVTTALGRLGATGRLACPSRHRWVLHGSPPPKLSPLRRQTGLGTLGR
jgi:CRP-like cAMP-binding protein